MLQDLFSTNSDWTLTIIRIILGVVFFAHGAEISWAGSGGPGLKETMRAMHASTWRSRCRWHLLPVATGSSLEAWRSSLACSAASPQSALA